MILELITYNHKEYLKISNEYHNIQEHMTQQWQLDSLLYKFTMILRNNNNKSHNKICLVKLILHQLDIDIQHKDYNKCQSCKI